MKSSTNITASKAPAQRSALKALFAFRVMSGILAIWLTYYSCHY